MICGDQLVSYKKLVSRMSREGSDILEMAAMIARDYLQGPWTKVTPNNIVLKKVNGGLSNWLYQMSLPTSLAARADKSIPRTVLLRFHGQVNGESAFEHIVLESVVFTLLSERRLGPELFGIFPGGRIEEFLNARPLSVTEMAEPEISRAIAEKMAQIHKLQVPITKIPTWMFDLSSKYINTIEKVINTFEPQEARTKSIIGSLLQYDLRAELDWLRDYLESFNSPIVFCHNDLNEGNILKRLDGNTESRDLVVIDYEYCAYNYRAFDLANHFTEHTVEYTSEEPYFRIDAEAYPSRQFQMSFAKRYLETYSKEIVSDSRDLEEDAKNLLNEVDAFRLACHFFWALWSAANAMNKIPFGYWEFFAIRFETYLNLKEEIVSFEVPGNKRKKT